MTVPYKDRPCSYYSSITGSTSELSADWRLGLAARVMQMSDLHVLWLLYRDNKAERIHAEHPESTNRRNTICLVVKDTTIGDVNTFFHFVLTFMHRHADMIPVLERAVEAAYARRNHS